MPDRSERLRHLFPTDTTQARAYTAPSRRSRRSAVREIADRAAHVRGLIDELQAVAGDLGQLANERQAARVEDCAGVFVDVQFEPSEAFPLKSLTDERPREARYPSYGLRFDVTKAGESPEALLARVNAAEGGNARGGSDLAKWDLGRIRTRGSIHSDVWRGTAAALADKSAIAVVPVNGWWRFRRDPDVCERRARYALVVSIETDAEEVDVYTPVLNQIAIER